MIMSRTPTAGLLVLLLGLTGCMDRELLAPGAPDLSVYTTCTVMNTNDAGAESLRARLADISCDIIDFDYDTGTITLEEQLVIDRDVMIDGPTGKGVKVSGNDLVRVFLVIGPIDVSIDDLVIEKGYTDTDSPAAFPGDALPFRGAGIRLVQGSRLKLEGVEVRNNTSGGYSSFGEGAGIHMDNADTELELKNSLVADNVGSGIYARDGKLTLIGTTIDGNIGFVAADPSAIAFYGTHLLIKESTISNNEGDDFTVWVWADNSATIENSTISGNDDRIAALGVSSALTLSHTTVTKNRLGRGSGLWVDGIHAGIYLQEEPLTLVNSVVAGNTVEVGTFPYNDISCNGCEGVIAHNSIIGTTGGNGKEHGVPHGTNGNIVGLTAGQLAGLFYPLASNGGPTKTHGLRETSIALDHVPLAACSLTKDQRGESRPAGDHCDAGSFEGVGIGDGSSGPPVVTIDPAQVKTIAEGDTLTVSALFEASNGGPYLAQIQCHAVGGGLYVAGTAEVVNFGPPEAGTVTGSCPFGDTSRSGTFPVTVTLWDDDDLDGSASFTVTVTNVAPTVVIDETGAVSLNGVPTFLGQIGGTLDFSATVTDPGSDDLSLSWNWGHGAPTTFNSLVNGPGADPFPSPGVDPRTVVHEPSKAWPNACLYPVVLTATDDDAGARADTVRVIIAGTSGKARGAGYWYNSYRDKKSKEFQQATLTCYLGIAGHMSAVFDEVVEGTSSSAKATAVLNVSRTSDPRRLLEYQLLAVWLNFANGAYGWNTMVDTDRNGVPDTAFSAAVQAAEAVRLDGGATAAQLIAKKNILESINLMHGG